MPKLSSSDSVRWVIPGILGLVLIIFARQLTDAIVILLGVGLILGGASGLISWWQTRQTKKADSLVMLAISVLAIALGIWIVTHVNGFKDAIRYIVGALLILTGLQWFYFNRTAFGLNGVTVMAALCVVLGIVIIAVSGSETLPIRLLGIGLVVNAGCIALGLKDQK